jgi:hypothetical protein
MGAARGRTAALAGLVAALVLVSLPLLGSASRIEATSWIDAPLDAAFLPLGPYGVVAHSADQRGVAEVVFQVDGTQAGSLTGDGATRLMTSRFQWIPADAGTYVLTVLARNADGAWGAPASATVVIAGNAPTAAPTAEPGASPGPSPTAGATLGPGRTPGASPGATPGPGATRTPAPVPTRTKAPTPAPTFCNPPTANLLYPIGFELLAWPSQASPEFLWEYLDSTACITAQTLHIENQNLGVNLDIPLGTAVRSYQQRSAFGYDPSDSGNCGHYSWYVIAENSDGVGEPSAPGSFKVCLLSTPGVGG